MNRGTTHNTDTEPHTDRGQAYTLEGFIGAMVVLMAVLFALQSVVITPTSGGLADRSVQSQVQQEAQDALVVSDQHDNLSALVRHWEGDGSFAGASGSTAPEGGYQTFSQNDLENASILGQVLNDRFADQGWNYNLEYHYTDGTQFDNKTAVYQGSPPSDAITASYMVTLYDDQYVKPDNEETLEEFEQDPGNEPMIPRATNVEEPVYNVVEVRLVVW
ncbi:hypothetical protein C482_11363 [Natrialba chahannaoensis JCM 10990]|uniref:Uncharacterized protein n=1 Tax=Natrialba chahannaoensis JCM 10990 TaxID=1227492 RepID=M0ALT0_9EURY|nr:hypothetical protein [Natrialba chahannaoensis]ELY98872.1 hypothetical protein C482_11363 [Natrialba chahannaoensis JCM 10990]